MVDSIKTTMSLINTQQAAIDAISEDLHLPTQAPDGRYNTINNTGAMYGKINKFTQNCIEKASINGVNILEIGPAYGETCMHILRRANVQYTGVDTEEKHLKILARRVKEEFPEKLDVLKLIEGCWPDKEVLKYLEEGSYDFILAENVLHFLNVQETYKAFRQFHRLLKPNGILFFCVATPYISIIRQGVREKLQSEIETFTQEVAKHSPSHEFEHVPGFFESVRGVSENNEKSKEELDKVNFTYSHGFVYDHRVAKYFLEREEFVVESCEYNPISTEPFKLDGKESVGVVARKS